MVLGRELENNEWERSLKPLAASDVRGMPMATFGDEERQRGKKGKGKAAPVKKKWKKNPQETTLLWIWLSQGAMTVEGRAPAMNKGKVDDNRNQHGLCKLLM
jgi:hypothetical protein